jgi:hypothetical protein
MDALLHGAASRHGARLRRSGPMQVAGWPGTVALDGRRDDRRLGLPVESERTTGHRLRPWASASFHVEHSGASSKPGAGYRIGTGRDRPAAGAAADGFTWNTLQGGVM